MNILNCNQEVEIINSKIQGIITGICIREQNYITYEITFTLNGDIKTVWIPPSCFLLREKSKISRISFIN